MKKSWKLLEKIVSGEKTIESRWYKQRCEAWGKVKKGDIVYFKNSGEPVSLVASVARVMQFADMQPRDVRRILQRYGGPDGIGSDDMDSFFQWAKNKRYCVLVFLKKPKSIKPFRVNKTGFGSARAWLTVPDISAIRIP